ncbi:MAG: DUF1631 family protein [Aquabacterium sp.]|jgi:hypothetical protein|uniref:DUF1631 family protein n=1 Tax=Aquabacterium sp. TaxID=1872578 RepID=UPI001B53BAC6|nr:DUF1631 family protein [Aquabacterium sp.]MBP7131898.1 DUF1631 family protein [Aquabacterium sp.]MBP9062839.1 DUF1631 family protein [Aquabacterium sp.]MDQ5925463.1 hypothetical protein [Pseudomonadota bacterium]
MSFGPHRALALTARLSFLESLIKGVEAVVHGCVEGVRQAASEPQSDPATYQRKRDLMMELVRLNSAWLASLERPLNDALRDLRVGRSVGVRAALGPGNKTDIPLSLLDDSDVERDLAVARLAHAIGDHNGSEFSDLNARLQAVGGAVSLSTSGPVDVLMPHWVARMLVDAWLEVGLNLDHWADIKPVLMQEIAPWTQEAYHHVNGVLLDHGVRPEIDLRPFIRRAKDVGVTLAGALSPPAGASQPPNHAQEPRTSVRQGNSGLQPLGAAYEETHMLTQTPGMAHGAAKAQNVLDKLTQVVARQVPGFEPTTARAAQAGGGGATQAISAGLGQAIQAVGDTLRRQVGASPEANPVEALQTLQQNKQALKEAASTPSERAIIEIVALLFQAILTEERLPASIRVWFARLQMPVLRVAMAEPDFFATTSHPARILIDRMGSCVMGFVGGAAEALDDALHKEIRRVVQVIEAYPDTGRRVFLTVLTEFERFLETYFREENQASRRGVSLAQQVEQRETCAIQYTIELRKMLDGVPVHDGVREFMFHVWADVLAHSAVVSGPTSDATKALQRAAADLIWSASAKTSREERAEVLRRLPHLLKSIREGMARSGLPVDKQDEQIKALNTALAAAFSARSATISSAHLQELTERLEALGDVLPDLSRVELDAETLRDLSGHESDALEVVAEGGSMPTPGMLAWARELQIGAWFELDYRGRQEPVQLVWSGLQQQLLLFVTPAGRGILFQLHRLAAFLQAGLLVPQEDESLTTRATRAALAKLDADPARLLN